MLKRLEYDFILTLLSLEANTLILVISDMICAMRLYHLCSTDILDYVKVGEKIKLN